MSESISEVSENSPEIDNKSAHFTSELLEPRWAVISFDKILADDLSYPAAAEIMQTSLAKKIAGLCIITSEAAARMKQNSE